MVQPLLSLEGINDRGTIPMTRFMLTLAWILWAHETAQVGEQFIDRGTPNMNLLQDPRPGQEFWSALIDTAPSPSAVSVRTRLPTPNDQ